MTWFYTSNGNQSGPITQQELASKVQSGEVKITDFIWKEGMADWLPLNQVAEFSGAVVSSAPQFGAPMPPRTNTYNAVTRPQITNYLWQAICVTLFCCMPFGIVAIVFATKVDGLVAAGDYAGAQSASDSAKKWVNLGAGIGLVVIVLYLLLVVIGGLAGAAS